MNYLDEIFTRTNIQQIREFLLHGTEEPHIDLRPYVERTECALKNVTTKLHESYTNEDEYERIATLVYDCVDAFEEVFMEIGLQAGAIITAQVCQNMKIASEEKQV